MLVFSVNPRLSHERASKRIVRYLKGTKDKGIIICLDTTMQVYCVNDDFTGSYSVEAYQEPVPVFSQSGYVIFYLNCPVICVSKMQTELSLFTVESECIALS